MTGRAGEPDGSAISAIAGSQPEAPSPAPRRRRRRWILIAAAALGLVLVLGVAVPRFAAGWLAKTQLDRLGIESEGVTSLAIKLWNSRVDLGAVEFWGADAERGRIDAVSMTYDVGNLFAGRALVDRVRIRGIDIHFRRDDEGRITANGVELAELLGPAEESAEEVAENEGDAGGPVAFGVGLDGLLLESSRALLETDVGTLLVEIDRLVVEDMRSWDPDHPAVLNIKARANDVEIEVEAQAHLFSDTIMVDAHVSLDSVDLDKIIRFTGPLGFQRREGEVSIDLAVSMQIEPDGRVLIAGYGDLTHDGAELSRPNLEYSVGQHRIGLYGAVIAEPAAAEGEEEASVVLKAAGDVRVRSKQVAVKAPEVGELTFEGAEIHLANLAAVRHADGQTIALQAEAVADVDQPRLALSGAEGGTGPTLSAGSLRTTFNDLSVSVTPDRSEISGGVGVEAGDLAADLPAADERAAIAIHAGALEVALSALEVAAAEGGLQLGVTGTTEITGIDAELVDGPRLKLGQLANTLDPVDVALDSGGSVEASGAIALTLGDVAAGMPFGQGTAEVAVSEVGLSLADLDLAISENGGASLAANGSIEVAGTQAALLAAGGGPSATTELAELGVTLDRLAVEVGSEAPHFELETTLEGESFDVAIEGEGAGSVRLGSLSLEGLEADQTLAVDARSLTLAGLEVEASDRTIQALAGGVGDEAAPEREAGAAEEDEAVAVEAAPSPSAAGKGAALRLDRFTIERPAIVRFTDTSVEPPMEVETAFGVEVTHLDTTDPSQRADLRLDATINKKADLEISGWTTSANPPDFDLDVNLSDLQLGLASPYAAAAVGMDIESGELATATAATATGGDLGGQIDLEVEDLVLVPVSEAAAEKASSSLGVPVNAVVGLLEDSDGLIKLVLPVSGTVQEPEVDITDAVNKAVAGTIKTLFPPTAIAGMLMSESGGIEFRPIAFEPGSAELGDEARGFIDGFVGLLNEKPRLEVLPCGRATAADASPPAGGDGPAGVAATNTSAPPDSEPPAPDPEPIDATSEPTDAPANAPSEASSVAMLELAKARALAVETYLIEEQGLAPERVRTCRPRYDSDDSDPPRVDLTLT